MLKKVLFIILGTILLGIIIVVGVTVYYGYNQVPVLSYHDFYVDDGTARDYDPFSMDIDIFREQMQYLKDNGYKTLTADEFYCWQKRECKIPRKSVVITFDDGYQSNYDLAFPIMKELGLNGIVFIIGKAAEDASINERDGIKGAYMSLETLEKMKEDFPNIEIGGHSYDFHSYARIMAATKEELTWDLDKFHMLMDARYFAYPQGAYKSEYIEALKEKDYKLAFGFGRDNESRKKAFRKSMRSDNNYLIPRYHIHDGISISKFKKLISLPNIKEMSIWPSGD